MIDKNRDVLAEEVRALMHAASLYLAQGKVSDAIFLYDKVIGLMPDYAVAYYERGRARHRVGDLTRAMKDLKQALSLDSTLIGNVSGEYKN